MSFGSITCSDCGVIEAKTGTRQFYCKACAKERKKMVAREYAKRAYPKTMQKTIDRNKARVVRFKAESVERSRESATSIADIVREIEPEWVVRTHVPFLRWGSKNAYAGGSGFSPKEACDMQRQWRCQLSEKIRYAVTSVTIKQNKLWVDIFVQKTSAKSDAVNFVDVVCDAIKDAIDLDDRWFCIRRVDWEIVKSNPRIYVGLSQENIENAQACSYCGRLLPFSNFSKRARLKFGIDRVCRDCRTDKKKEDAGT